MCVVSEDQPPLPITTLDADGVDVGINSLYCWHQKYVAQGQDQRQHYLEDESVFTLLAVINFLAQNFAQNGDSRSVPQSMLRTILS